MNKIATTGKRFLKNDQWHDSKGAIPGSPANWDPPMTEEEVLAAAEADPDAQPLSSHDLDQMHRVPFARYVRMKLRMSQSQFAERFDIPLDILQGWESRDIEPDAPAMAYLRVIAQSPASVEAALSASKRDLSPAK